ncbi:hypothetical protein [Streptomyces sp. NPDC058424]|uniref:hypothetical protein n=1 Tax=Streptomyces sp. NPDC058424 TaxID=3346491 RepID=UPI003647783E
MRGEEGRSTGELDKTWAGEEVKLSHTDQQLYESGEKMVIQAFTTGRLARGPTVSDVA